MLSANQLLVGTIQYVVLLLSLSVHESLHAWTADRLGDPTARYLGRVTLNPIAHIDLLGTVIFPLIMIFNPSIPLIGWAKPVPVNPQNLRRPRRQHMWIAAAGPLSNLGLATGFLMVLAVMLRASLDARMALRSFLVGGAEGLGAGVLEPVLLFLWFGVLLNTLLGVFNLLPIAPLDGGAVFQGLLPVHLARHLEGLSRYGFLILFGLLFTGALWYLMAPFYYVLYGIVGVLIS